MTASTAADDSTSAAASTSIPDIKPAAMDDAVAAEYTQSVADTGELVVDLSSNEAEQTISADDSVEPLPSDVSSLQQLLDATPLPRSEPYLSYQHTLLRALVDTYQGKSDALGLAHDVNGTCTFKHSDDTYSGSFIHGIIAGVGVYTAADQSVQYSGKTAGNQLTDDGNAWYQWPARDPQSTYQGSVLSGLRHGGGRYKHAPTSVQYDGEWLEGRRHGSGQQFYNKEQSCGYEGQYHNGQRHGHGTLQYSNGNFYSGDWRDDVKCGHGVMQWYQSPQGQQREHTDESSDDDSMPYHLYAGTWSNNQMHGVGRYLYYTPLTSSHASPPLLQNTYGGEFRHHKRHGSGIFFYADGSIYTGAWRDNLKHGAAVYVFTNGGTYTDGFENDEPANQQLFQQIKQHSLHNVLHVARYTDIVRDNILRALSDSAVSDDLVDRAVKVENSAIQRFLNQFHSKLHALYTAYTHLQAPHVVDSSPSFGLCLRLPQLHQLCIDYQLVYAHADSNGCTYQQMLNLTDVNDLVSQVLPIHLDESSTITDILRQYDALSAEPSSSSVHPQHPLLYWQFLLVLIRLADRLHPSSSQLLLSHKLQRLYQHLQIGPTRRDPVQWELLQSEPIKELQSQHSQQVETLCQQLQPEQQPPTLSQLLQHLCATAPTPAYTDVIFPLAQLQHTLLSALTPYATHTVSEDMFGAVALLPSQVQHMITSALLYRAHAYRITREVTAAEEEVQRQLEAEQQQRAAEEAERLRLDKEEQDRLLAEQMADAKKKGKRITGAIKSPTSQSKPAASPDKPLTPSPRMQTSATKSRRPSRANISVSDPAESDAAEQPAVVTTGEDGLRPVAATSDIESVRDDLLSRWTDNSVAETEWATQTLALELQRRFAP